MVESSGGLCPPPPMRLADYREAFAHRRHPQSLRVREVMQPKTCRARTPGTITTECPPRCCRRSAPPLRGGQHRAFGLEPLQRRSQTPELLGRQEALAGRLAVVADMPARVAAGRRHLPGLGEDEHPGEDPDRQVGRRRHLARLVVQRRGVLWPGGRREMRAERRLHKGFRRPPPRSPTAGGSGRLSIGAHISYTKRILKNAK